MLESISLKVISRKAPSKIDVINTVGYDFGCQKKLDVATFHLFSFFLFFFFAIVKLANLKSALKVY